MSVAGAITSWCFTVATPRAAAASSRRGGASVGRNSIGRPLSTFATEIDERVRVHGARLILERREQELTEEALADLRAFLLEGDPSVVFEHTGMALARSLMFGWPPDVDWLELNSISYYVLTERFADAH